MRFGVASQPWLVADTTLPSSRYRFVFGVYIHKNNRLDNSLCGRRIFARGGVEQPGASRLGPVLPIWPLSKIECTE